MDSMATARQFGLDRINRINAWKILPLLMAGYVLNTIEKSNVGFASLEMNQALGFTPAVFGLGASLFFVTYTLFEVPSNIALRKVGARKWLARILITWGIIAVLMGFVYDKSSFYIVRMMLGAAEAGWFPGVLFYLSLWFPDEFRARSVSYLYFAVPLATVINGPLSGALLSLPPIAGLANWQILFIVQGIPSIIAGFLLLRILKETPAQASWLSSEEKDRLAAALKANQPSRSGHSFRMASLKTLMTPQLALFSALNFLSGAGLYVTLIWTPRILKQLGNLTNLETGLIAAIPFLAAAILVPILAITSDRMGERKWHIAVMFFLGACALLASSTSTSPTTTIVFVIVAIAIVFGIQGVFFATATEALMSVRHRASLAAGLAIVTTFGNIGGFVGPYGTGLLVAEFGNFKYALLAIAIGYFAAFTILALCQTSVLGMHRVSRASLSDATIERA